MHSPTYSIEPIVEGMQQRPWIQVLSIQAAMTECMRISKWIEAKGERGCVRVYDDVGEFVYVHTVGRDEGRRYNSAETRPARSLSDLLQVIGERMRRTA